MGSDATYNTGTEHMNLPRGVKCAGKRRDNVIEFSTQRLLKPDDNEALRVRILVNTSRVPRATIKGCLGNGLESRRRLKNRSVPEIDELRPRDFQNPETVKATKFKDVFPQLDRWERELRKQGGLAGAATFSEVAPLRWPRTCSYKLTNT